MGAIGCWVGDLEPRRDVGSDHVKVGMNGNYEKPDLRTAGRRRVLKSAVMAFGGGGMSCTVRNVSATGAALDVLSPIGIPELFTLIMDADHSRYPCRVVWRKEKRIGVTFEPAPLP